MDWWWVGGLVWSVKPKVEVKGICFFLADSCDLDSGYCASRIHILTNTASK